MTTPLDAEAREIAAALNDRERECLMALPIMGGQEPLKWRMRLCDLGLANCIIKGNDEGDRWCMTIQPLGLAVRAILSEQQ
jgi:hypothetical protein